MTSDNDSRKALSCPKCSKIMTKYQITGCNKNRLDLCDGCDEAWLDGGEWKLLKALQLSKNIPKVFTEAWQSKITEEISEIKLKARFIKLLGASDAERADEIRSWLKNHKKRAEILSYIVQSRIDVADSLF